jgi:Protein of unknown function (DUF3297)
MLSEYRRSGMEVKRCAACERPYRDLVDNLPMTDQTPNTQPPLPDRLSIDVRSPHHVPAVFEHDIGIRFNDKERFDVSEYCISEGWVKVPSGKTLDRKGQPLLIQLKGRVEVFYK